MEVRTQSIAFRNAVGRELQKVRIPYMKEYYEDGCSTDFMLDPSGRRIAIECKFNTLRDFPKTIGLAKLLLDQLGCEKVLIVVPYKDSTLTRYENPDPERIVITEPSGIADLCIESQGADS